MQGSESPLEIEVSWAGTEVTVTLAGDLDLTNAPWLAERLAKVTAAHPERLVLDLSGLAFMDVAGARTLDRACDALDSGCPVIVRGFRPIARRVFHLTGFMQDGQEGRPWRARRHPPYESAIKPHVPSEVHAPTVPGATPPRP